MKLADVNAMDTSSFVAAFGDIAEHSPWVARQAMSHRPFGSRSAMIEIFIQTVRTAPQADQLDLLRAHPDLAGKAAVAGSLTQDSKREQAGAGLDALTAEEFSRFTDLNDRYRNNFSIPFIFAVKGATKHQILQAFEQRIGNGRDVELAAALEQVCRIVQFRIEDKVSP